MIRTLMLSALVLLSPMLLAQPPVMSTPDLGVAEMSGTRVVTDLNDADPADFGRIFPPTLINTDSDTTWIRISNGMLGGANLELMSGGFNPGVQGAQPEFSMDLSRFQTTVPPGSSTEIGIYFDPMYAYTGVRTDAMSFWYQADPVGNPGVWSAFYVCVRAQGVTSETEWLSVRDISATGARLYTNPASYHGAINLGSRVVTAGPGSPIEIFLVNEGAAGTADITLGTPARVSGSGEFAVDTSGFSSTLAPGASTSFCVGYDPAQTGPASAIVEFTHSDSYATNPFRLEFIGTGLGAPLQMYVTDQPGSWWVTGSMVPFYTGQLLAENQAVGGNRDFGTVNGSAAITLQVDNGDAGYIDITYTYYAGADLTLGTPVVIGDPDFSVSLAGFGNTVASAGTTTFVVTFTPQANGVRSALIEIPHGDASERAPFRINVAGIGDIGSGGGGGGGGGGNGGSGGGCVSANKSTAWTAFLAALCGVFAAARVNRRPV
jgi:hypothetical protein